MKQEDLTGKTLGSIRKSKIADICLPVFKSAINGKEVSEEYMFNNNNYLIRTHPVFNKQGEVYLGLAITQNITFNRQTSEKDNLLRKEAETANHAMSLYLAHVSHEIRTPLNAILGFTEQLLQTKLNKQQQEHLKIIDKSSEYLHSLINDILVLSKIDANELRFETAPFKIQDTVRYVFNLLSPKADEKKLLFTHEIDENLDRIILGDAVRLRQILINMLNNGIKFTHHGHVSLECSVYEEFTNEIAVKFEVSDTGIGISPGNLETIFDQFRQADSTIIRRYGGTGLGLTICKKLIEMQNGSLSVTSQEGTGTTFKFTIPYRKGKETDILFSDIGSIEPGKLNNIKVLMVDDDSVNRLLGVTILNKFNINHDIANSGEEAILKLNNNRYDIVLLDIHMPGISGIDVAKYLRNEKEDNTTRIIAVTAAVMKRDFEKYNEVGINNILIKPFREINLFKKLCEALEIKTQPDLQPEEKVILKKNIRPKSFNLGELKKMGGTNKDFSTNMLTIFIENSENTIYLFQQLLKEENWEQIGETAHKILPSFRHLEVQSVIPKLLELKTKTMEERDFEAIPSLVRTTVMAIRKVIKELKQEIKE